MILLNLGIVQIYKTFGGGLSITETTVVFNFIFIKTNRMKKLVFFIVCLMVLGACNDVKEKTDTTSIPTSDKPSHGVDTTSVTKIDYEVHTRNSKAYNGQVW